MLRSVIVGDRASPGCLTVTPELFEEMKRVQNRSWGVRLMLFGYPFFRNLLVVRSVPGGQPDTMRCFDLQEVPVVISVHQLEYFEGKLIGYTRSVPGFVLRGILDSA